VFAVPAHKDNEKAAIFAGIEASKRIKLSEIFSQKRKTMCNFEFRFLIG